MNSGIWTLENKEDPESRQGLRYSELIAPMVKAIQELTGELSTVKSQMFEMQNNLSTIISGQI